MCVYVSLHTVFAFEMKAAFDKVSTDCSDDPVVGEDVAVDVAGELSVPVPVCDELQPATMIAPVAPTTRNVV